MNEGKNKRKQVSKSARFEVFKRDAFKCQYCGRSSPDVVLEVDHIHPVSKGGENDIMNLVTSCRDCNSGKSDKTLDDSSAIQKQRKQLEKLNKRREQLEMMVLWREGLEEIAANAADAIVDQINKVIDGHCYLNEAGRRAVQVWLRKFSVSELIAAIDQSAAKRAINSVADAQEFVALIPKIAAMNRKPEVDRRLYYIRGIVRRRMYCNENQIFPLMRSALSAGADVEWIEEVAKTARNWTEFRSEMEEAAG
ncbi:MAG: HNH endonuclease [Thauera sp.]|jgi:hypothetical protein|nr:HNH endonuclease [Thauera sp.]